MPQPAQHDQDAANAANGGAQCRKARGAPLKVCRSAAAPGAKQLAVELPVRGAHQTSAVARAAVQASSARAEPHASTDHVGYASLHAPAHEGAAAFANLQLNASGRKRAHAAEPAASIQVASRVHAADTASKALSPPSSHGAQQFGSDAQRRSQRFVPSIAPAAKHSADESASSSASSTGSDSGSDGGKRTAATENISPPTFSSIDRPLHNGFVSNTSMPFTPSSSSSSSSSAPSEGTCEGGSDEWDEDDSEDDESKDDGEAAGDLQAQSPPGAIATQDLLCLYEASALIGLPSHVHCQRNAELQVVQMLLQHW